MTPQGRRCCERYDALMARLPDYEAAVEALKGLVADLDGMADLDLVALGMKRSSRILVEARAVLARLRESVPA